MTNIQEEVANFIDQDVSIRRGLIRNIINTRALAFYIYKNLGLNCSIDAVISAIRRYNLSDEAKEDIKKRYKLIAEAKISSRTRMLSALLKKEVSVRKGIMKLYEKIDFSKGEVLRILEVSQFIKIIFDDSNFKIIQQVFNENEIIGVDKKLGEISLIYKEEVINTPGVFSALSSELAMADISIRDGMICGNEHIFIVSEDDLMKALHLLNKIRKWGEKK